MIRRLAIALGVLICVGLLCAVYMNRDVFVDIEAGLEETHDAPTTWEPNQPEAIDEDD